MLDNFSVGAFLPHSGFKWTIPVSNGPFRRQSQLNFGAGSVHFEFGSTECLGFVVVLPFSHLARGTRGTRGTPPTTSSTQRRITKTSEMLSLLPTKPRAWVAVALRPNGVESKNLSKHGQGSLAGPL